MTRPIGARWNGLSPAESRLGRLAEMVGWLTREQLGLCLQRQAHVRRQRRPAPHLGEIAVEEGLLTPHQVRALLRIQVMRRPAESDRVFGGIAVSQGWATRAQVDEALSEQQRLLSSRGEAPFLGVLLVEKGVLREEQVREILDVQDVRGQGFLLELRRLERDTEQGAAPPGGKAAADAESAPPLPTASGVVYRCRECGRIADGAAWAERGACSVCGGLGFTAAPLESGAVGYSLAERRRGPAVEDGRLGLMAFFAGWMTSEQVAECLDEQRRQAAAKPGEAKKFGQVAVAKGHLTEKQVQALLRMQALHRPSDYDHTFGAVAVRLGFATRAQVDQCLQEQLRTLSERGEAPPLGVLMVERRIMSPTKVRAILRAQAGKGRGPLAGMGGAAAEADDPREKNPGKGLQREKAHGA